MSPGPSPDPQWNADARWSSAPSPYAPMLLFSPHITARLQYIIGFFSKELFDAPIRFTTDQQEFLAASGPRINYSDIAFPPIASEGPTFLPPQGPTFPPSEVRPPEIPTFLPSAGPSLRPHEGPALPPNAGPAAPIFSLRPAALLFESGISPQPIECFEHNGHKAFFRTDGDLSFDIFAASFYLLSRYEEYLPHEKDEFGRYAHTNSLAWREGFLDIPLVNYWMLEFKLALQRQYPDLVFRYPAFKFVPTYDIDLAYAYLYKEGWRNLGAAVKEMLTGKWSRLQKRIAVLRGRLPDPYDAYEWLDALHLYCRMKPYYFFLAASRRKGVDRNIPPSGPGLQELVAYHAAGYRLGIHPSWQSGDDDSLLREEIEWMERTIDKSITRSRQHFIRLTLPRTYRRLLFYGIDQEFSMGYGSINGFRASVASSFFWYDLEKEEETGLRLFPFCFMDANAYYEQRLTPAQAMTELMHYYYHIRKVNGLMVTIWHNTILGTDEEFAGWREVYEVFLKEEVFWDM